MCLFFCPSPARLWMKPVGQSAGPRERADTGRRESSIPCPARPVGGGVAVTCRRRGRSDVVLSCPAANRYTGAGRRRGVASSATKAARIGRHAAYVISRRRGRPSAPGLAVITRCSRRCPVFHFSPPPPPSCRLGESLSCMASPRGAACCEALPRPCLCL